MREKCVEYMKGGEGEYARKGLEVYGVGSETDFSNGFFHFWLIENSLKVARPLSHQLFSIAISHLESLQNYTRSGFVQIERGAVVVNFAADTAQHTYGPPTSVPPFNMALLPACKSRAALVYSLLLASACIEISRTCEGICVITVRAAYVHVVGKSGS